MDEALCKSFRDMIDVKIARLETKVDAHHSIVGVRMESNEKALQLAKDILDKRMERDNEIREELREQTNSFLTRKEYEIKHETIEKELANILREASKLDGRMVGMIFIIPIIVTVLITFLIHVLK